MGDVNDFQNFSGQFQSELDKVECEAIASEDQETIQRWVRDAHTNLELSSITEYLRRVRLTAARIDVPLTEASKDDVNAILFEYEHDDAYGRGGGGMSEHTLRNYRKGLRVFFQWLGREWADELSVGSPPESRISPDDMLSQDDIAEMVSAVTKPRDLAMIEFFADTGARASMAGSLRVGDIDVDSDRPHFEPNAEATGLKDAPQHNYPLIDCVAPLRSYLRYSHPQPENDDAALFHRFVGADTTVDELPDAETAMSSQHMRRRLRKAGEKAGVEKPTNPHNFRHSAVTRMYREGFTKQQIQHRVGWTLDTAMWSRYVHLHSEQMNDAIYQDAGMEDAGGDEQTTVRRECGQCRETLAPHHEYCPVCGSEQTAEAREVTEGAKDAADEELMVVEGPDGQRRFVEVRQVIDANPERVRPAHSDSPSE